MNNIDTYKDRYTQRLKRQNRFIAASIIVAISICIGAVHSVQKKQNEIVPIPHSELKPKCSECHTREWAMAIYFKNNGSPAPRKMAKAVLATKSPKLFARIAVEETNGNHKLRKYGYKKAHDGAFGVNRKDWGAVSDDPVEQAIQAEMALDTFIKESKGNLKVALNRYGGDRTRQTYAQLILKELQEVP